MPDTLSFTKDPEGGLSYEGIYLGRVTVGADGLWYAYGANPDGEIEMDRLPQSYDTAEDATMALYDRLKYLFTGQLPMIDTSKLDAALVGLEQEKNAVVAALADLRNAGAAAQAAVDAAADRVAQATQSLTAAVAG